MSDKQQEVWVISELIYDALTKAGIKCTPVWDSPEWRIATEDFIRACREERVRIPFRAESGGETVRP